MKADNVDTFPWPGDELAFRVSGETDKNHFFRSGDLSVKNIEAALGLIGRELKSYDSILDFGCGCGRILLWMQHLAGETSLYGTDIDERAIKWNQQNLPWASFKVNGEFPPLQYEDGQFDLVFANSVFTHIDEAHQDQWLQELLRVIRPGGHALLSVHGEHVLNIFESSEELQSKSRGIREELSQKGISFISDDAFVGGPFPDFYHSTFHAPWYIFEHWGQQFTIRAHIPRGCLEFQDFVLLERPVKQSNLRPIQRSNSGSNPIQSEPMPTPASPNMSSTFLYRPAWWKPFLRGIRRVAWRILGPGTASQPQPKDPMDGVFQVLRQQGERINRLEADIWDALNYHKQPPKDTN